MINEILGNLLTADVQAIAHCANCFCTMGSGIAKQIKLKFPEAYVADMKTVAGDKTKYGKFTVASINNPDTTIKLIYNLYGQYMYGKESRKLNYECIYTALESMKTDCEKRGIVSVGFPKNMGCMLAGGKWSIVEAMIHSLYDESNISVTICQYQ